MFFSLTPSPSLLIPTPGNKSVLGCKQVAEVEVTVSMNMVSMS